MGNIMNDHGVLNRMQEMCEESCNPDQFERFMELKKYLLETRGSLKEIVENPQWQSDAENREFNGEVESSRREKIRKHFIGIYVPSKAESAAKRVLHNPNSSKSAKTKAGSALSQPRRTGK